MGQSHCHKSLEHHGDESHFAEERSHVNLYELASMSAIAVACRASRVPYDAFSPGRKSKPSFARAFITIRQTALVCIENTHTWPAARSIPPIKSTIVAPTLTPRISSSSRRRAHLTRRRFGESSRT